jgi:hypothetical protein
MTWPFGQEGSAGLLSTDASPLAGGSRINVKTNGGVPAHIDQSLDKRSQHERISNPNEFRAKSSSFITGVVANRDEMKHIKGAAVSANPLGDCIFSDQGGSQNKRDVGYKAQDVKPKLVYLTLNFSVFTTSNDKLCSERGSGSGEGYDYHARLNAATAAKLQIQAGLHGIDVQPQGRPVVVGDLAPALISYNATCFGPSVKVNHQAVCTELHQPWVEDEKYPALRVAAEAARIRARPGGPDGKQLVADGGPGADAPPGA